MIDGVKMFDIRKFADNRGFLSEVWRASAGDFIPKQMNFTVAHSGVIKAFHFHEKQQDLWFCTSGNIEAVLFDRRKDSPTFGETQTIILGEHNSAALLIPTEVAHGYRVLGDQEASLVYLVDQEYDAENPDEGRIDAADKTINFNWETEPR